MNTVNSLQKRSSGSVNRQQKFALPEKQGSKNRFRDLDHDSHNQRAILSRLLNRKPAGTWYAAKVYPYWQQYS